MLSKLWQRPGLFQRPSRRSEGSLTTTPVAESAYPKEYTSDIAIFDMELFTNDNDLWYAKVEVQWCIARAIEKEHVGHAVVNPKDIIKLVESKYKREIGISANSSDGFYPDSQIFNRIKSARATKNEKTLQTYLDELNTDIASACRRLRYEKVAELDANSPFSPDDFHLVATPSPTTTSYTSPIPAGSPSPKFLREVANDTVKQEEISDEKGIQSTTPSTPEGPPTEQRLCLKCKKPARYLITEEPNKNGNGGRPYFHCKPCKKFHSWADDRGIHADNPECDCGKPSRKQASKAHRGSGRLLHYVCSLGECGFFCNEGPDGEKMRIDEKRMAQMLSKKEI